MIPPGTHRQRAVVMTVLFSTVLLLVGELVFTGCGWPVRTSDLNKWKQTETLFRDSFLQRNIVQRVLQKHSDMTFNVSCYEDVTVIYGHPRPDQPWKAKPQSKFSLIETQSALSQGEFQLIVQAAQEVSRSLGLKARVFLSSGNAPRRFSAVVTAKGKSVRWTTPDEAALH